MLKEVWILVVFANASQNAAALIIESVEILFRKNVAQARTSCMGYASALEPLSTWPRRLLARTPPSQGGEGGSTLLGAISILKRRYGTVRELA